MSKEIAKENYNSPLVELKRSIKNIYYDKEGYIIGRLLTIVDGLVKDTKQNKAVKDMVHEVFVTKTFFGDNLDEELAKFRNNNCPNIENGYKYKIEADYPHSQKEI